MFSIRRATSADLAAIAEIQKKSREASSWTPDIDGCDVAECFGCIAAFLVTRQVGPEESEILNLAVDPAFRGRGFAKALVQGAIRRLPGVWFLEVRESNAAAIGLYKSLGFQAAGRRENYYSGPAEAAIVMRFHS